MHNISHIVHFQSTFFYTVFAHTILISLLLLPPTPSLLPFLPPSLQVDCLAMQLHRIGKELERADGGRMDELFYLLRDGFLLQEGLSSMARLLLLEVLEFRAGKWVLSDTAHQYYYSEVAS